MLEKLKLECTPEYLNYKFYDTVEKLYKIDFNSFVSIDNLLFRLDYLAVLEETLSNSIQFNYIVFFDNEIPVGLAITQLINFNSSQQKFQDIPCSIGNSFKNQVLQHLEFKLLICGNLFTCGEHGFIFDTKKIPYKKAYDSLIIALRELRKNDPADKPSFILLKEFLPDSISKVTHVVSRKFRPFEIDVTMILIINQNWNDFDDYLQSMRTKFRSRAKTVLKKSSVLKIYDFSFEEINTYSETIDSLYNSVIDNAQFKIEKLNAEVFSNLKKRLGEKFIFKAYFLESQLVGFSTAFILKDSIEANHIGINYQFNKKYNIYQKMLYDYVDLSIKNNRNTLNLGRTAETIKSTIGAKPVSMKLFVRHGNSISNKLLKPLIELISPSEFELRTPFKSEKTV